NRASLKGVITALTPLRFHRWYYRKVLGRKHSGTHDHGPFETHLRHSMAATEVQRLAERNGFNVVHLVQFENRQQRMLRSKYHLVGAAWTAVKLLTRIASFGR